MTKWVCPFCGDVVSQTNPPGCQLKGGWFLCNKHKVGIKPSKYKARCAHCLQNIPVGSVVLMALDGNDRWQLLHSQHDCDEEQTKVGPPPEKAKESLHSGPFAVLHLLPTAPSEVIRAVYKTLAVMYHPDTGGDEEQMKRLNAALDEIKNGGKRRKA